MELDAVPLKRNGLSVVSDIVVAPQAAFASLRERTYWIWGFALASVLGMIGAYLQIPAGEHVVAATLAHQAATDPQMQGMSPEKQHQVLQFALTAQQFGWLFVPIVVIVAIAVAALILTIGNAIGKGGSSYKRLFGLAACVSFITYGLGALFVGALVSRLGPDSFATTRDILAVMPSLGRLAPENAPKLAALLSTFNPFQIWSFVLIGFGLKAMTKMPTGLIWATAFVAGFGSGAFGALFIK